MPLSTVSRECFLSAMLILTVLLVSMRVLCGFSTALALIFSMRFSISDLKVSNKPLKFSMFVLIVNCCGTSIQAPSAAANDQTKRRTILLSK